jgi:peptidoglycan/xylan/chitin deacetylase (PgdA/CDA1 family)
MTPGTLSARVAELRWSVARCLARAGGPSSSGNGPLFRLPLARGEEGRPLLALTFDDGPDPRWTPRLLDVLAEHQVTATFFLIGREVIRYPRIAARIASAGHLLGNHSMDHPRPFAARSTADLRRQIQGTQDAIAEATGVLPQLFRAPGGGWSRRVLRLLREAELAPVDWCVDPRDWREPGADHIARSLLRSGPGDVVLCHDGGGDRSGTLRAVQAVLPALGEREVVFTPLFGKRS